jgi:hypothetical protein
VKNLVGCGNVIQPSFEYDLKAMIPLLMVCFETLKPSMKACTFISHDDFEEGNMFGVGPSF